ncbi:nicotinate (nicotinamide) nucleotide adenylyltransferase [Arcobacter sp. FWKO B]|nr:nicotinate (nicotinamide) nucleotide adenylyltransferase [Arcobacter sp. FWKO B]
MNIAIFGGSFDPPHIGHEKIVQLILEKLDVDILFVVPTFLNPFKKSSLLSPVQRFNLVKTIFNDYQKVEVLDYEINQNSPVPTIKTVKYLSNLYDINKLYVIIGDDHLASLHLWDSFDELERLVEFVVINRYGSSTSYESIPLKIDISSSKLRENMDLVYIPDKIKNEVKKLWKIE